MSPADVPSFAEAYRAARPVFDAAVDRVAPAQAVRVVEYVLTWVWLTDHDGREPTAVRHQHALGVSRATYFRRRADFRRAFPGCETPLAVPGAREILGSPSLRGLLLHT